MILHKHTILKACLLGVLLLAAPCVRADGGPKEAFASIAHCIRAGDASACRQRITAASRALYDRFVSYGLLSCLPKDMAYVSQERQGQRATVQASLTEGGEKRFLRLIFAREGGQWKLDAPESLRVGLGEQWRQQVEMTEQIYLLMKQQLGARLNCGMIQGLAEKGR